ncbi:MAG: type I restriction endonuclease subunit R [Clostridia bacterium]|nr:type I restriction endonuclease subunit R [Clostridia bacterium]
MSTTDTSEKGLESLIVASLTGQAQLVDAATAASAMEDRASGAYPDGVRESAASYAGGGYVLGRSADYDRDHAVDLAKLLAFLRATQPRVVDQLGLDEEGPRRLAFLARLQGEIAKRGIVDILRRGIKHGPASVDLFYDTPSPGNAKAAEQFGANVFSVTRQLRYSKDETPLALDLCLFVNGLPTATFELKNSLTKQTVEDAVQQYMRDRDPREPLFELGRCLAHFAVDDQEVRFCTHLKGKASWFLPFNKGYNNGAGNPPNSSGIKTDYLWRQILTRESLTGIIENYAQLVENKDPHTGKRKRTQVFPRFHQLDVVRKLLEHVGQHGVGHRYLIQHSAGSGKSNSIAWLAHQLVGLERDARPVFDSVIVVTDRKVLDSQIKGIVKQFAQVSATVGHAEHSGDLRRFLAAGKKIIITTVQKFPFILDEIGDEHRVRSFAILIDEAHSSQGGRTAAQMNIALSSHGEAPDEETVEDAINRIMEARKMLTNASYFAFTATPKNKTLEIFGEAFPDGDKVRRLPFHTYTMKQAIQEGFILDVLQNYTPVESYYRLMKKVEDDPEFDTKKAQKKLRRFVESNDHAVRTKAEIMVDHFHDQVAAKQKIGGEARAMVVTGSIERAIQYYCAVSDYLRERKSPYGAIVAFSGEHEHGGIMVTEASLNGFPSNQIPDRFREDPYRFLICADKFQTGYDEPLLHTMYVDKALSGIKAVQTLSRLNRAHPRKYDTFVLDFQNDVDTIRKSFQDYYQTTILSEETDPNKLHDLKTDLDNYQVYNGGQIGRLVQLYLGGAQRDKLDPILDSCVDVYVRDLDEDEQVDFKGKAKAFARTYGFLASILPYSSADWEKLAVFLNFLIPRLPAPMEDDLSKGILEAIDMDSYRVEVRSNMNIRLDNVDAEIDPVPTSGGGHMPEPELDRLSSILRDFNDMFGNVDWKDKDKIGRVIAQEIPVKVAADKAYQNAMKNSDKQNAKIEHDKVLQQVILEMLSDHAELYKRYSDDPDFRKWLSDAIFAATYKAAV